MSGTTGVSRATGPRFRAADRPSVRYTDGLFLIFFWETGMKHRSFAVRMVCGVAFVAGLVVVCQPKPVRAADDVVDPEVKRLAKMLSDASRSPAERVALAKKLGAFDEDKGKPAARALCAAMSGVAPLRTAALESLQKVHPKLYPEVATVVTDQNPKNHYLALGSIGKLKEDGSGAVPALLSHMKFHAKKGESAVDIREEFLTRDKDEVYVIPVLRDLGGLRGNALDARLRFYGFLEPYHVSAGLTAMDLVVLSRIAPQEPATVKAIVDLMDHKSNLVRFAALVGLDQCDVATASAHQKTVKKHKQDNIKPIRELAVDLDKKFDAHLNTKQLEKKP